MPAESEWLVHVPEIISLLRLLPAPVLDRAAIETLFGVKRRRAIQLLAQFGGYQAGKTFLVNRDSLLRQLEKIRDGDRFQHEAARRERLAGSLAALRKQAAASRVQIPLPEAARQAVLETLPAGIALTHNRLEVEFEGAEDLLAKLFHLAQAISNDWDRFGEFLAT
jgi:hypothetical protein